MSARDPAAATGIDWSELRRRLDATAHAGGASVSGEAARAVLAERARLLARPARSSARGGTRALMTLRLGGETWGLEARLVWEVFKLAELARLPGSTAPVVGITSWRGLILPALDLRSVLGMSTAALDDLHFAVALGVDRPVLAILADAVDEIQSVAADEIVEPPDGVAMRREYLLGVTRASLPVLELARLVQRFG